MPYTTNAAMAAASDLDLANMSKEEIEAYARRSAQQHVQDQLNPQGEATPEPAAAPAARESVYPTNINGDPEFASILITIDHAFNAKKEGLIGHHVIQKAVYSTQLATETLWSLFDYYGDEKVQRASSTVEIIGRAYNRDAVFIYTTPNGLTQILMGTNTLDYLREHDKFGGGSFLMTVNRLVEGVRQLYEDVMNQGAKGIPPLSCVFASDLTGDTD